MDRIPGIPPTPTALAVVEVITQTTAEIADPIILQKKNVAAQEVNVPAGISCYLGVTEPAIFGVNLKYGFPFICGMIGSAISAVVCVMTSTTANAVGVGGIRESCPFSRNIWEALQSVW